MKRRFLRGLGGVLCIGSMGFAMPGLNAQVPPHFAPLTFEAHGPSLSLTGGSGDHYVVESSPNLADWFFLYSGTAVDGQLAFGVPSVTTPIQRFFRAYAGTPVGLPTVVVVAGRETNQMATTLVTRAGGALELILAGNGRISLGFPSNTLSTATYVTMTLVTNIDNLPFGRGVLGAVEIEPADLAIIGAATLEFTFDAPPGFDRREVVSFAGNTDGTGFHLVPDRVRTNSTLLAITRGGLVGTCLASPGELNQMSALAAERTKPDRKAPDIGAPSIRDSGSASAYLSASQLCFPERVQATEEILSSLGEALEAVRHRMGLQLAIARQAQPSGATDDGLPADSIGLEGCIFYHDRIVPLFPLVANNCSLLTGLARMALGISRQLQLIGYEECPAVTTLADLPICDGARACLEEIKQCCALMPQEREKFRIDLLTIIRQQQLLGVEGQPGCFGLDQADVARHLEECGDLTWNGSVRITEFGEVTENDPHYYRSHIRRTVFAGIVIGEVEFGGTVQLTVRGNVEHTDKDLTIVFSSCGGDCGQVADVYEDSATGNHELAITLFLTPSGTGVDYALSIGNSPTIRADMRSNDHGYHMANCNTCTRENHSILDGVPGGMFLPSLFFHQGNSTDPNSVQGTSTMEGQFDTSPSQISIHWNFSRSPAPP